MSAQLAVIILPWQTIIARRGQIRKTATLRCILDTLWLRV